MPLPYSSSRVQSNFPLQTNPATDLVDPVSISHITSGAPQSETYKMSGAAGDEVEEFRFPFGGEYITNVFIALVVQYWHFTVTFGEMQLDLLVLSLHLWEIFE
jgi:hypothetical protein